MIDKETLVDCPESSECEVLVVGDAFKVKVPLHCLLKTQSALVLHLLQH